MKNLRYVPILNGDFTPREAYNWMRLPTHYLTESVDDFARNKSSLKPSIAQKLMPNNILAHYAIIVMHNVAVEPLCDEAGKEIIAVNNLEQEARLMKIYDQSGEDELLWPDKPGAVVGYHDARIVQNFNPGDVAYRLTIWHNLNFNDSFIVDLKKNPENTTKRKKGLREIVRELCPDPKIAWAPLTN